MKNSIKNKFIVTFMAATLALFAAVGLKPVEVKAQPYIWTCYAGSATGIYYWSHPNRAFAANMAMRACVSNTPFGFVCSARGCE